MKCSPGIDISEKFHARSHIRSCGVLPILAQIIHSQISMALQLGYVTLVSLKDIRRDKVMSVRLDLMDLMVLMVEDRGLCRRVVS